MGGEYTRVLFCGCDAFVKAVGSSVETCHTLLAVALPPPKRTTHVHLLFLSHKHAH